MKSKAIVYGSVCSGIEAATVAWHPLGFKPAWFSEIEPFPCAVLAHHYPDVPNLGDMTEIHKKKEFKNAAIDLLVGGTPCQSFSVAGLRKGLSDPRGNLALHFLKILDRKRPRWVVWENVPGVLSSWSDAETCQDGSVWQSNDFDTFICGLRELGYGIAWRVLDAQYFGVPQRRRRVFVIGYLGDWRPAAAVLFERTSLSWDPAPSRETRQGVARSLTASTGGCSAKEQQHTFIGKDGEALNPIPDVAWALQERDSKGADSDTKPGHLIPVAFSSKNSGADAGNVSPPLRAGGHHKSHANASVPPAVAFKSSHYTRGKGGAPDAITPPLSAEADKGDQDTLVFENHGQDSRIKEVKTAPQLNAKAGTGGGNLPLVTAPEAKQVQWSSGGGKIENPTAQALRSGAETNYQFMRTGMSVRRLTPRECERLQGFPDDYTLIPWKKKTAPDGPRYKALGNSMARPVMWWIGARIQIVDQEMKALKTGQRKKTSKKRK